ncbi:flavodoxin [Methanosphaera sp.]
MSKTAIIYFSASTNKVTKNVAQKLAQINNDDIYEIEPVEIYTSADLNWNDSSSRTTEEKENNNIRPEIASSIDISNYDNILLGFPVWWYTAPSIIKTFIEDNDFTNKTVKMFVTSGGTGINEVETKITKEYPEINWKPGVRLTGRENNDQLKEFIEQ